MKKFEEPKMELIKLDEIVTSMPASTEDQETVIGGGGFGPIVG